MQLMTADYRPHVTKSRLANDGTTDYRIRSTACER